jgi:hypothetical protein
MLTCVQPTERDIRAKNERVSLRESSVKFVLAHTLSASDLKECS